MRTSSSDGSADGLALVASQIVHDHNVAGGERGDEELLDVGGEAFAVDRTIDHQRGIDPVMTQGREEGQGAPMAVRYFGDQLVASRCPAAQACHVGLGPCFIDEHEPARIKPALICLPAHALARDVPSILLGCEQRFF